MFLPILFLTFVITFSNGIYYSSNSYEIQKKGGTWPQGTHFIPSWSNPKLCHQSGRPSPCSNQPGKFYPAYPPIYVINSSPCLCDCGTFGSGSGTTKGSTTDSYLPPTVRPEYVEEK